MASNPNRASSGAPKRRSVLAELGIKPNAANGVAPSPSPSPRRQSTTESPTTPTAAATRRASLARASKTPTTRPRPLSMAGTTNASSSLASSGGHRTAPSSPTVQRSSSKPSVGGTNGAGAGVQQRKTPAAINTAKATAASVGGPKTPTPTTATAKRRSIVSTSTSSQGAPNSPLLRRGSTATAKRRSIAGSPSPSASSSTTRKTLEQLKELQQKVDRAKIFGCFFSVPGRGCSFF